MKRLVALLLAAALALAAAGPALAAATYATTLGISHSGANFSGRVKSSSVSCVSARRVVVYRKRPGPDPSVGAATSTATGTWRVHVAGHLASGDYYARTAAARRGASTCGAAKSVTTHAS